MGDLFDMPTNREPSEHIAGRIIGMLVFLGGIALLVLTFVLAYQGFHNTDILLPMRDLARTSHTPPSYVYARAGLLLILLFVMGYVASLIASRGAQLFFSARKEVRHDLLGN
jgi:hypothetical protein